MNAKILIDKKIIKSILMKNIKLLKKYKVRSISLFGSYVRNEQNKKSDIDLLVVFKEQATLFDIIQLQYDLQQLFHKKVSIVSRNGLSKYIGPYILQEAETIAERL